MNKPYRLNKGDKVAIVSLSSGILGEQFVVHELDLGVKRSKYDAVSRFEYFYRYYFRTYNLQLLYLKGREC